MTAGHDHGNGAQTPRQLPKEQPQFTEQHLQYIMGLAKVDSALGHFIEQMDERAPRDVARTAIVSAIAYRAAEILAWRDAKRKAVERELQETIMRNLEKPAQDAKPRIPAAEIPDLKEQPDTNGGPKAETPGA